jgi:hypothetical protein
VGNQGILVVDGDFKQEEETLCGDVHNSNAYYALFWQTPEMHFELLTPVYPWEYLTKADLISIANSMFPSALAPRLMPLLHPKASRLAISFTPKATPGRSKLRSQAQIRPPIRARIFPKT